VELTGSSYVGRKNVPEIKIVDRPKLKSFVRDTTEWSITTLVWGFWIYLLLPVLNFVLWLLGIRYFYVEVFQKAEYMQLLDLLGKMGWTILVVFLVLRLWGYYNYVKFGKKNRRKSVSSTTAEQLSEFFHIPPEQIPQLQLKKEVVWPIQQGPDEDVPVWLARSKK
jgi:poly-beta-1,6-N-acetyl-D-glucosamine biosynthesis protein PgaD